MICPKCSSRDAKKYGKINGKQRYKCRRCGMQYTIHSKRGMDDRTKAFAMTLWTNKQPLGLIAKLVGVTKQTVSRWTREFISTAPKPVKEPIFSQKTTMRELVDSIEKEGLLDRDILLLKDSTYGGYQIGIVILLHKNE